MRDILKRSMLLSKDYSFVDTRRHFSLASGKMCIFIEQKYKIIGSNCHVLSESEKTEEARSGHSMAPEAEKESNFENYHRIQQSHYWAYTLEK